MTIQRRTFGMRLIQSLLIASVVCVVLASSGFAETNLSFSDKKVVFILLDGTRADTLERLISEGGAPNIARLKNEGLWVENAISVFPSTTGPAYAPFVTGLGADKSGLSGIRQYIRKDGTYRAYCGTDLAKIKTDMNPDYKTIYEMLPSDESLSVVGMIDRGAKNSHTPTIPFALNNIRGKYLECDNVIYKALLKHTKKGLPRYTFVSFHAPDAFGHRKGAEAPQYTVALKNLDTIIGYLLQTWKKTGDLDKTVLIISADHGMESTDKKGNLAETLRKHGVKVHDAIPRSTIGFNFNKKKQARENDAIVAVSGNACVEIYLKGKINDRDPEEEGKFNVRPSLSQIRAYPTSDGRNNADLIEALRVEPCVGFLVVRDGRESLRVYSVDGESLITRSPKGLSYKVVSNNDPLQLSSHAKNFAGDRFMTDRQWLYFTRNDPYPDAVFQLWQFMMGENSGDIVINAAPGYEPWNEGQAGVHGGASRAQMRVPLLVWGCGIKPGKKACARTVDVFPTVLEILGISLPPGLPGISLLQH